MPRSKSKVAGEAPMITSTLRLVLVSGLGLATLLVGPRSTLADYYDNNFGPENGWVLTVQNIAFVFSVPNACYDGTGESVNLSGPATVTTKTLMDNGNFLYVKEKQEILATGTGDTTGAAYTFSDLQISRLKIRRSDLPATFILKDTQLLNGQGVVPSQMLDIYTKFQINANGSTVSDISDAILNCR
jgi:hypothetical protein